MLAAGLALLYPQAADRRKEVEVLKKRQASEEVELKGRRGGVEAELADVQPLIDQVGNSFTQCYSWNRSSLE